MASLLIWGEHCHECARPACYFTCDLYESRPDRRCRLFTSGAVPNEAFSSWRGSGVELDFKPWSKMLSRGNTQMLPARRLLWIERLLGAIAPLINAMGRLVHRFRKEDIRWCYASVALFNRLMWRIHHRVSDALPQALLLEIYNPGKEAVPFLLSMDLIPLASDRSLKKPYPFYKKPITLPAGYSRQVIPYGDFRHVVDSGYPFVIALAPQEEKEVKIVVVSSDLVRFTPEAAGELLPHNEPPAQLAENKTADRLDIKCVVWDLDNTLWQGVLVENDSLTPNENAIETIIALDKRGILNSIASKNSFDDAWAHIEKLGLGEFFLHPRINWQPKGENVRKIAKDLNIGLDTFALVDDNAFEREEVTSLNPQVLALDVDQISTLLDHPRFQGSGSTEANLRRRMYQEAIVRDDEQERLGLDYSDFLRSCRIVLEIKPYDNSIRTRITELVQRVNQLNFSGRHYRPHELQRFLDDPTWEKWVLKCSDKFGTYGIVGFGLIKRDETEVLVQDFMLSCRVQGKYIEQAFFSFLVAKDPKQKLKLFKVNFKPTDHNLPAREVLSNVGFMSAGTGREMELHLDEKTIRCDFITIEE